MPTARICMLSSVHFAFDTRIFQKEARSLAQAGFEVVIIARHDPTNQRTDDVEIVELPRPEGRLQRMLGSLRLLHLALCNRADLYVFHDPELMLVGVLLKIFTRTRVIYDIHEDVHQQILAKEWLPRPTRSLVRILYQVLERLCLPFTDALILSDRAYLKYYPRYRTLTVLNYPLLSYAQLYDSYVVEGQTRPSLVYAGSIRAIRGLYDMLELACHLKTSYPNILLRLVGPFASTAEESKVRELVRSYEVDDNVDLLGRVSYVEVHRQIAQSDIGLVLLHPDPNYLNSLPTKLFEYMMMGKPVVISDFPLWRKIVQDSGCGLPVDPLNPEAVRQAVMQLLEDRPLRQEMGNRGREAVLRKYNWDGQGRKLVEFCQELLKKD